MNNEAWIMALGIAADAIYRQDGGIGRSSTEWHSPALHRAYVAICKEISRLENIALQEDE